MAGVVVPGQLVDGIGAGGRGAALAAVAGFEADLVDLGQALGPRRRWPAVLDGRERVVGRP